MFLEFLAIYWYLFIGVFVLLGLLLFDPIQRYLTGVKMISPTEIVQQLNRNAAIVVDVSEEKDYSKGHIAKAFHCPLKTIGEGLSKLNKHLQKPVIVVSADGRGQMSAAKKLKKHGFTEIYLLQGGLASWTKENMPLVKK